ncbi:hypothetical protein CLOP_g23248 [Closterium sp. NIES-67]|nr:hypothetical protein CLOP_g23248 [Closterium sp. NIES-67]
MWPIPTSRSSSSATPCNTNALICLKNAPKLNPKNFHALTKLDENRAKCQLALKAGVFYDKISNMTIWGNHSTTMVPDFVNARILGFPATDVIRDRKWLEEQFTPQVQTRAVLSSRSGAGRQQHPRPCRWWTPSGRSPRPPLRATGSRSGVYTKGNTYGIDDDLIFSLPCRSKGDGDYEVVPGLIVDEYLRARIQKTEDELLAEKKCVSHLIGLENGYCDLPEGDTMLPGEQ